MISGERIDNFRKGWAIYIWGSGDKKVHYWTRRSIEDVESSCGLTRRALFNAPNGERQSTMHYGGDFPLCRKCRGW